MCASSSLHCPCRAGRWLTWLAGLLVLPACSGLSGTMPPASDSTPLSSFEQDVITEINAIVSPVGGSVVNRGKIEVPCRATDSRGRTQPQKREAARLDGYANNWYDRVRCVVV